MKLPIKHSAKQLNIFSEMTALSKKYGAINLSQGFPDFPVDPELTRILAEVSKKNNHQYAPLQGNPFLIEELIHFNLNRTKSLKFTNSEITIVPGATYGIYAAISSIIEPGDEIIILEPAYDSYLPSIEMNGGIPILISMEEDFKVNFNKIKEKITEKTKGILVNSPHNPSGNIWKKEDWDILYNIIKNTDIIVISDEVYDGLIYDNESHYSVMNHEYLKDRAFAIFSFGKMFHITGWKVGYVVATEKFSIALRNIHQYISFSVNAPAQEALAEYLNIFDPMLNIKKMQQKRDYFFDSMLDTKFNMEKKAEGGYFQIADFSFINPNISDKEFSVWLTQNYKVASIPLSSFYKTETNRGKIRFCFAKSDETLEKSIKMLKKL